MFSINPLGANVYMPRVYMTWAYSFECTFFRTICLTAKALHRITMHGFLVGATEPEKRTLKRIQLRILGFKNSDYFRVTTRITKEV